MEENLLSVFSCVGELNTDVSDLRLPNVLGVKVETWKEAKIKILKSNQKRHSKLKLRSARLPKLREAANT